MTLFMSFTWFAIEAFLSSLLVIITANRWGRRFSGCLGLCLLTIFSFIFILVKSEIAKIIMGSLSRLVMNSIQCLFCLYIPEFFPTTLRTQGTALVHFLSVLMHFLAPYLFFLVKIIFYYSVINFIKF
ncbi:solute carrier family 22 member 1-like [Leptopilina heterotoma]|uniref:solute carrier family 22 member 1-like n=1 Tax=Leptopilina heterotoma TaxID=63436 RepID=UPI001CA841A7|nr:solute carrier family 22 member 1-like [Leptopilina heterotoma]